MIPHWIHIALEIVGAFAVCATCVLMLAAISLASRGSSPSSKRYGELLISDDLGRVLNEACNPEQS